MKLKSILLVGALVALIGGGVSWAVAPGSASATTSTTKPGLCNPGWYVNPDETALMPQQTPQGLLFKDASLIHHAASGYTLKTIPARSVHVFAEVRVGVAPLFKMETGNPYSTVNRDAHGKWWSSKIAASAAGGQSNPVNSPAELIGKFTYTEATTITSFGTGYGNDTGNTALVTAIMFGYGHRYSMACSPPHHHKPTHSPTPSTTPTPPMTPAPTPSPTESVPGEAPAPTPVKSNLAVTG